MVEAGDSGAAHAMALHDEPTKWLSVVQIGITSISILNGIVGDAAFSAPFARWLQETLGMRDRPAEITATGMVVVTITFLSIVFGELVPKRLGLQYPETIARLVSRPMEWLSVVTRPFVRLLSWCTEAVLKLLGVRGAPDRSVTEEEIAASLEEGLDAGVIEKQEHQMVRNVFRLPDRQVGSMMIPAGRDRLARGDGHAGRRAAHHCRGRAFALSGVPRRPRRRARHRQRPVAAAAVDPGQDLRARGAPAVAGVRARDAFRHGAARAVPGLERAARVRGRRVRRGPGDDHGARRAGGDHRRIQHRRSNPTRGRCGGTTAAG